MKGLILVRKNPRGEKQKEISRILILGSENFIRCQGDAFCNQNNIPKFRSDRLVVQETAIKEIQKYIRKTRSGCYQKIICEAALANEKKSKLSSLLTNKLAELVAVNPALFVWEPTSVMKIVNKKKKERFLCRYQ